MKKTNPYYEFSIRIPVNGDDGQIKIALHCDNPRGPLEQAIANELECCVAEEICRGIRRGLLNDCEQGADGKWRLIEDDMRDWDTPSGPGLLETHR